MKHVRLISLLCMVLLISLLCTSCGISDMGKDDTPPPGDTSGGDSAVDSGGQERPDEGDGDGNDSPETPLVCCDVRINEVCSKNDATAAPDGGFYDWIELYHAGSERFDLSGWSLSDSKKEPRKFIFPAGTVLLPGAYLVIWADGVGITADRTGLYAAFKISNDGENLYLTDPEGNLAESIAVPALRKNTTWGRATDGDTVFASLTGTPGATNDGSVSHLAASVLSFTHESGFYQNAFSLGVTAPAGYRIYYTTDCTDPATSPTRRLLAAGDTVEVTDPTGALTHSADYFASLAASGKSDVSSVEKCFVLRACAVDAEENYTVTVTKNYFIGKNNRADLTGIPLVLLTTDAARIYGEEGLFNHCSKEEDGREEQVNLTFLSPDGSYLFDQEAGMSIRGSSTRGSPQKNLNIIARASYDGNSRLLENLFPDISYTKSFALRHDNMNSMLIGQGFLQDLVKERDIVTQDSFYVTVFIDGEYFGLYNLYERVNDDFLAAHYGVESKNTQIVKFGRESDSNAALADYKAAMNLLRTSDLTDPAKVAALEKVLDLDSLIDLWCVQVYLANGDFAMSQNISAWRVADPTVEDPENPYADGRWRFVLFDLDYALCGNLVNWKDAYTRNSFTCKPKNTALPTPFCDWREVQNFMTSEVLRVRFGRAFLEIAACYDYETLAKPRMDADLAIIKARGELYLHRFNYRSSSGAVRTVAAFDSYTSHQYAFLRERASYIIPYLTEYLGLPESALR